MNRNSPLAMLDLVFKTENSGLLPKYEEAWDSVKRHYPQGWCYDFWAPNRFLNRCIYFELISSKTRGSVLDFACYDGLLVAALRDAGFDAYGYESFPCWPAFEALRIKDRVNTRKHCEVVIAFGIAQEFKFEDFLAKIAEENDGLPEVIFFDREPTRPTVFNAEYFKPTFLIAHGIQVVKYPNCVSDRSNAELMIWNKHDPRKN